MNIPVVGMTGAVIIMFIGILVMYTYVDETRQNQQKLSALGENMNKTLTSILERQAVRWTTDNMRFNATLAALGSNYVELQSMERQAAFDRKANTEGLSTLGDIIINNTNNNLNLTKFNRAAIMNILTNMETIARSLNVTEVEKFDPRELH